MISLKKILVGVLLVGATGTLIYAAPDDLGGTDETTTVATPGSKTAILSPVEMTVSGDEMIASMHTMLRHVTQLRQKAEREKDIIKLNCINDKLIPMKAQVNLADSARRLLEQMVSENDDKGRYSAYADITVSNDKVKDLRDEADACVGDALTYIGKTDVQVVGPQNPLVPGDQGFGEGIEPPVYRTPFD